MIQAFVTSLSVIEVIFGVQFLPFRLNVKTEGREKEFSAVY